MRPAPFHLATRRRGEPTALRIALCGARVRAGGPYGWETDVEWCSVRLESTTCEACLRRYRERLAELFGLHVPARAPLASLESRDGFRATHAMQVHARHAAGAL